MVDMVLRRLRGLDPKDVAGARQAVNIKRIVAALRKERAGMVQSLPQYLFCYRHALLSRLPPHSLPSSFLLCSEVRSKLRMESQRAHSMAA